MSSLLAASDLVALFREELSTCALRSDESLVILSEPTSRQDYVGSTFAAAEALGLRSVASVVLPGGSPVAVPGVRSGSGSGLAALEGFPEMLEFLKSVDMIVDVTIEGHIHAEIQQEILRAGTRILFVCDPPEVLARNMTGQADKARALAARDLLKQATKMHVSSDHGTDLHVDVSVCHPGYQTGFADDPGRWDHWPSCMVVCWPGRCRRPVRPCARRHLVPVQGVRQRPDHRHRRGQPGREGRRRGASLEDPGVLRREER